MGIEPITYHLQGGCSTIELRRRPGNIFLLIVTHRLKSISKFARLRKAEDFPVLQLQVVSLSGYILSVKGILRV